MSDLILDLYGACTPQNILSNPMIKERMTAFMHSFIRIYHAHFGNSTNLSLDVFLLRETIESCLCDVYRFKLFRNVSHEDTHKRTAFFMKWIVKLRPIQNTAPFVTKRDIYANELFAMLVGLSILSISPKRLYAERAVYFSNLMYLLHYHSCDPEQLASEMYLLDELMNNTGVAPQSTSL